MKKWVMAGITLLGLAASLQGRAEDRPISDPEPSRPAGTVLKYEEPKYLAGAIYGQGADAKKLLFNLKRVAARAGATLKVQREYTYPDGKLAARERVVYEGDALVLFELEEFQLGAIGSAKIRSAKKDSTPGTIEFEYSKEAGSKPKTRTEVSPPNGVINDMLGPFLAAHWEMLARREKVKCRYLVVPRAETVGFTFSKESESTWQGKDVVIVKMEASSLLLAPLVDPLFFTIEKAPPHHVLQYVGRTTPKIRAGSKWKDLDAITVFDWESAR